MSLMLQDKRLRRYQRFLKTLKCPRNPQPRLCSCPRHLHPRPWVHPPCRTSRPYKKAERSLFSRRSMSNPELATHARHHSGRMRMTHLNEELTDHHHTDRSIQHMYHDARILKETLDKIRQGDPLSKDSYNTVKKWSKKMPEEDCVPLHQENKKDKKAPKGDGGGGGRTEEGGGRHSKEEQQAQLSTLRELSESNSLLLDENKRLMRKVHRLNQRLKRQSLVPKDSRENVGGVKEAGSREDYVILSLKKKYDELLQYVLKVESENQKLKSLVGISGEQDGLMHDSDREAAHHSRRIITRLQEELHAVRGELRNKDEYIMQCEQHIQNLKAHQLMEECAHGRESANPNISIVRTLEDEWMRRLNETREMYDQAIQGYKNQLSELQRKLVDSEEAYEEQVHDLVQKLAKAKREESVKDQSHSGASVRSTNSSGDQSQNGAEGVGDRVSQGARKTDKEEMVKQKDEQSGEKEQPGKTRDRDSSEVYDSASEDKGEAGGEGGTAAVPQTASSKPSKDDKLIVVTWTGEEKYNEALELIVRRLENLKMEGTEVESIVTVIKDTFRSCLQEWRQSFQQEAVQHKQETEQLPQQIVDLQKKLRGKSKKIETLQKQCQDLKEENAKLQDKLSAPDSERSCLQKSDHQKLLLDLTHKLEATEHQLMDTKDLLQRAQAEKLTLQDQTNALTEKLNKKQTKLKTEREVNSSKEKEVACLQESVLALQHKIEKMSGEVNSLQEQLSTKDAILEHTSAQLEERIRECARLSSLVERFKLQQGQENERLKEQLNEQDSTSYKKYLESQAQVSRYHAQLSSLKSEKEHSEKTLRNNIRKLEDQVDQLQLRNSTLQRQLATITSTYHSMFTNLDLNPPKSPGLDGLGT